MSLSSKARSRASSALDVMPPARRQRWALARRALATLPSRLTVIDAGCGDALLTHQLARAHPGWRIVGADLSRSALMLRAGDRAACPAAGLLLVQADLQRPLACGSADVVLSLECLTEIPDDRSVVSGLAAALRPGGLLVLHVMHAGWCPVLPGSDGQWRHEVRHGYEEAELRSLLTGAGLLVELVVPTMRGTVQVAQEVRDRCKHAAPTVRLLLFPVMVLAAWLDTAGATWGRGRGMFVLARRPQTDVTAPSAAG